VGSALALPMQALALPMLFICATDALHPHYQPLKEKFWIWQNEF
jgi:hypothetical protein